MAKGWIKGGTLARAGRPMVISGHCAQRVVVDGLQYELVYVKCGKGCSMCKPGTPNFDGDRPGHGPYWYCTRHTARGRRRSYIGVELIPMKTRTGGEANGKAAHAGSEAAGANGDLGG